MRNIFSIYSNSENVLNRIYNEYCPNCLDNLSTFNNLDLIFSGYLIVKKIKINLYLNLYMLSV